MHSMKQTSVILVNWCDLGPPIWVPFKGEQLKPDEVGLKNTPAQFCTYKSLTNLHFKLSHMFANEVIVHLDHWLDTLLAVVIVHND